MKTEMELWAVMLGASFMLTALLVLASAWLPFGLAGAASAQDEDTMTEAAAAPPP